MLEAFGTISFLNPFFLLGILFSGILIVAYLKKKPSKDQIYSSLYLLKKLPRQLIPKKKFSPPVRFFLELLALICLALALATPVLNQPSNKIALIFDTTLSMQAKNSTGETRLEKAKKLTKTWLKENAQDNLISLYTSAPNLNLIEKEDLRYNEVLESLEKLESSFSNDSVQEEIKELVKKKDFSKVVFISDKQLLTEDKTLAKIFSSKETAQTKYQGIFVGEELPNFYLQNLDLKKEDFTKNTVELIADIGLSGKNSASVEAEFFKISQDNKKELIGKNSVIIYPNKVNQTRISLETNNEVAKYQVLLKANSTEMIDSIQADNIAWLNSEVSGGSEVLVVSDESKELAKDLGLEKINYLNVKKISAEQFNNLSEDDLNKNALIVFYKLAPNKFPKKSSLFILPPEENKLFQINAKSEENTKISSWQAEHALTSYLKVPLINPGKAYIFSVPDWMKSIINSEQGSILFAGESRGLRFVVSGFEIFPFEGAKTPALSVLTLNLINWLANTKTLSKSASLYYPDESKTDELKQISQTAISSMETQNLIPDQEKNAKLIYNWFIFLALSLLFAELLLALFHRSKNV